MKAVSAANFKTASATAVCCVPRPSTRSGITLRSVSLANHSAKCRTVVCYEHENTFLKSESELELECSERRSSGLQLKLIKGLRADPPLDG